MIKKTTRKETRNVEVICKDCQFAYLMQSKAENPIVALCKIHQWRDLANWPRRCQHFAHILHEPIIHPMIPANLPFQY